ncbi:hemolysin XhlA family protein [Sutcliffiella rhizosphaerae]|uniref:hemolysin XhlA family protein n=1 Tax=Sutcliffiella rhizosphaerae TaxID=2880967 RepID=UPI001E4E6DDF|nr:hemolysin XhlA family protein [Sutcliffiella rhizosphaerae]
MEEAKVDIWKESIKKDINNLKKCNEVFKNDIRRLQDKQLLHDRDIGEMRKDLTEIKDDIKWLRRSITNAFIVGIIGGAVAIFYAILQQ